jgi:hypothetical protein
MSTTPAPTLREVRRGRAADELVLLDTAGRAVLLRGDGATADEAVRMVSAALDLLRETLAR